MSERQLTDGSPVPENDSHKEIDPRTGMQKGYVVLSPEERAKGFIKPVRNSYVHSGMSICGHNFGPWIDKNTYGYVARICAGPKNHTGEHGALGQHKMLAATQKELDRLARNGTFKGCGCRTTMSQSLAETYARDPYFYSGTYCAVCQAHFPLNEFAWEDDGEPMDPDLQDAWAAKKGERDIEARKKRRIFAMLRREDMRKQLALLDKEIEELDK